jgi:thiosulfate reductase cytochrome b subunit
MEHCPVPDKAPITSASPGTSRETPKSYPLHQIVIVQLRASATTDRRVARQSRRVLTLPGRRSGIFEPAIKAVAVSKNFMPQSFRSKMPREFVKAPCLRRTTRNRSVRSRDRLGDESTLHDQLTLVSLPPRPRCDCLCTIDLGLSSMTMPAVKPTSHERRLHPLPVRVMHWINAVAIFIMIGSGWKIYNDDVILGWLHFPDSIVIGKWAQYGLQWHFFGMWIFVLNGLAYLSYGIATGRFRQKLFPVSIRDILATVNDALHFRLAHDDLTHYNAVQKILYLGVMTIGVLIVISGLALWKPVQFSELAALFGSFQTTRVVHFLCMTAIVGFLLVHISLALLVPQSLVAMVTGGPVVDDGPAHPAETHPPETHPAETAVEAEATH